MFIVLWWLEQTLCNHDNALTEILRPKKSIETIKGQSSADGEGGPTPDIEPPVLSAARSLPSIILNYRLA
jgi:hypothetical protein